MTMKFPKFAALVKGTPITSAPASPPATVTKPAATPTGVSIYERFKHLQSRPAGFVLPAAPAVASPETREAQVHRLAANVINARQAVPGRKFVFAPVAAPKVDDRTEKAKLADAKAIAARISEARGHPSNNRSF